MDLTSLPSAIPIARLTTQTDQASQEKTSPVGSGALSDGAVRLTGHFSSQETHERTMADLDEQASIIATATLEPKASHSAQSSAISAAAVAFALPPSTAFETVRAEIESACPDPDLARALFQNQFQLRTEAEEQIARGRDPVTTKRNELRQKKLSQDQAAEQLNTFLKAYPAPQAEYDFSNAEKRASYQKLGQIISDFRRTQLPEIDPQVYTGSDQAEKLEDTTKTFNTRLRNFLAQHPGITEERLTAFLIRYNLAPQDTGDDSFLREAVPSLPRQEVADKIINLLHSSQEVFKTIEGIGHDEEAFCETLTELLDPQDPIYKDDGKTKLKTSELNIFIDILLKNFGIFKEKHPKVFGLVCNYFAVFGNISIKDQNTPQLKPHVLEFQNKAKELLEEDDLNRLRVQKLSGELKEYVEKYQTDEKEIRAQNKAIIEQNKFLPPENQKELLSIGRMKHLSRSTKAASEALLEPGVRTLLQKIATIIDPNIEAEIRKSQLIQSCPGLSGSISEVGDDQEKFDELLKRLFDASTPILKTKGTALTNDERHLFVEMLFNQFGISKEKNQEAFNLIYDFSTLGAQFMSAPSSVNSEFVKKRLVSFQQAAEEIAASETTKATTDQLSKAARTVIEKIIAFCRNILTSPDEEEE